MKENLLPLLLNLKKNRTYILDWGAKPLLPFKMKNDDSDDPIPVLDMEGLEILAITLGMTLRELHDYYKHNRNTYHWMWWVSIENLDKALDELNRAIKVLEMRDNYGYLKGTEIRFVNQMNIQVLRNKNGDIIKMDGGV